jgi:hypothetical protein
MVTWPIVRGQSTMAVEHVMKIHLMADWSQRETRGTNGQV